MLGSNESTTINIYFSSSASGYDATGTAVTINGPDQTGPVITATDATETATGLNTLSYTIPSTITAVDGVDGDVSGTLSVTVDGGVTTYSMGNNVSLALGSHTLLWTAQDSSSNDSTDSQTITVVPADASDSQSMLTSVVSSANVSSSNTLTVTIKDAYGNARSGDTVTFALTQPTNGSTGSVTASAVTDASGTATATLVLSELAGSNVVTATTGSVTETVTVTGTVTALAASSSTIVSGNASATAGQATTINVTVADASGTAITGQPVFLAVSGNATVSSQPTATDASGTTTGTITNNTAESVTVTAYIGSSVSDTAISDTHAVTYNAASASQLSLSTLRVMSAESTDTVTVTVTLQDQFGNTATSATDTVSFAETGAQASFSPTSIAASSGTATSVLTTSYTDSNDASFVVTVSSGSMTDASATVNIRAFSLSNSAGALSGNNYIKTGTSLSLQLAGGSNSIWAVTDSTGAEVTSSRLTNATDTGATYTAPSSNATDTITVTRSVASTDASTTLTLISLPQVVISTPAGSSAEAYVHGADALPVVATGGDGSFTFNIIPSSGVDNAVATFDASSTGTVSGTSSHTCVGVSGDCLVKVAAGLSSTSSGSVGASNAIRIAAGDGDAQLVSYDSTGLATSIPAFTGIDTSDTVEVTFKLSKTGTTTAITNSALGVVIKDLSGTNREIYAVLNGVDVATDGAVTIQSGAALKMFATNGTTDYSQTLTNAAVRVFDASDNQVTVSFDALRAEILSSAPTLDINLSSGGYYQYKLIVGAEIPVGTLSGSTLSMLPMIAEDQDQGLDLSSLFSSATNISVSDRAALNGGSLVQGHFQVNAATATAAAPEYPSSLPGTVAMTGTPYTLANGGTDNSIQLSVGGTSHSVAMSSTGEVTTTTAFTGVDSSDSVTVSFELSGTGDASGSIGVAVEDLSGTGREIYAVIDRVDVTAGVVTVPANATLYIYGVQSDGAEIYKTFTNLEQNLFDASGTVLNLSLSNLRDNIEQAFIADGLTNALNSFASPDGYYSYAIVLDDSFPVAYKQSAGVYKSLIRVPLMTLGQGQSIKGITNGLFNKFTDQAAVNQLTSLADGHLIYGEVAINGATKSVDTSKSGFSLSVEGLTGTTTTGSDATGTFNIHVSETDGKSYVNSVSSEINDASTSDIAVYASTSFSVSGQVGSNSIVTVGTSIALDTSDNASLTVSGIGLNNNFTYTSSDPTVFTVDGTDSGTLGVLAAVGAGSATLTVKDSTYGNVSTTITVTVSATSLSIAVTDTTWDDNTPSYRRTVIAGETITLTISSSNGSATVSGPTSSTAPTISNGTMSWTAPETGSFAGDYDITISDPFGNTAPIYVTVPYSLKVSSVGGVSSTANTMRSSELMQLTASGAASNTTLTFTVLTSTDTTDTTSFITDASDSVVADASGTAVAGIDPVDGIASTTSFKVKVSDGTDTDLDTTITGLTILPSVQYSGSVTDSVSGLSLTGVRVIAVGVVKRDGTNYFGNTDTSGTFTFSLPDHPLSNTFWKLEFSKDGVVPVVVTPTSTTGITTTMTTASKTVNATITGVTETKRFTIELYDTERAVVKRRSVLVSATDTLVTLALSVSEYSSTASYRVMATAPGYQADVTDTALDSTDTVSISLSFSGKKIDLAAADIKTTAAAKTAIDDPNSAVGLKLAALFVGNDTAKAAVSTAKLAAIPDPVSMARGTEFDFSSYTDTGSASAAEVVIFLKVKINLNDLADNSAFTGKTVTVQPILTVPDVESQVDATTRSNITTFASPVGVDMAVTVDGTTQTKAQLNAILAVSPLRFILPIDTEVLAKLKDGTAILRYADTLDDLYSATSTSGNGQISTDDILFEEYDIDAGTVPVLIRHLSSIAPTSPFPSVTSSILSGGGGCFIATAAYGSYEAPYVKLLRDFRDQVLLTNGAGQWFVEQYYSYSPPAADWIREREAVKSVVRLALVPLIATSWVILEASLMQQLLVLFGMVGLFLLPGVIRRQRNRVPTAG